MSGLCHLGMHLFWDALGLDSVWYSQARLEVHRFGITGYGKGKERVLERERAIMLGAKVRGYLHWQADAERKI